MRRGGDWLRHGERVAWGLTAVGAVLGFLASIGVFVVPAWGPAAVPWLTAALLLIGITGGLAARRRGVEIDVRRWRIVADSQLTSGEREYAHKEAERERRLGATAYLAGPLAVGYWAAYQSGGGEPMIAAQLQPLVPLVGYGIGWLVGRRWERSDPSARGR